jgi:hypothetical protein
MGLLFNPKVIYENGAVLSKPLFKPKYFPEPHLFLRIVNISIYIEYPEIMHAFLHTVFF